MQRGLPLVTKATNPQYLAEDLDIFSPVHMLSSTDLSLLNNVTYPDCKTVQLAGRWAPNSCCHAD